MKFSTVLQDFFSQRLIAQRQASPRTVASYRDTFRLLFSFAESQLRKTPSALTWEDLDAPFILAFLDHLERDRRNSVRTRNARLAAIRSFLHYASYQDPMRTAQIQRILAIPTKRYDRPLMGFLSREETEGVLSAPSPSSWNGQRDRVLLATMYNTGARVSEIIGARVGELTLDVSSNLKIHGKGRKERTVPLWKSTAKRLKEWLPRIGSGTEAPLFPNRHGRPLTRSGVESRLRIAVKEAAKRFPSLAHRRISPHTLRHTTAMHLLQSGVDITVIALWLGHESIETTHQYIEADLKMKEQALAKLQDPQSKKLRFRAGDALLSFLNHL
ncbi:MAG TPA: site-specific integrase [Candidatus Saccharimonadales bacterium]|nr:site-specific integrase [Candidatus Saccharimonadales bacterium]